jgi:exosortase A-associated hydrolase 2
VSAGRVSGHFIDGARGPIFVLLRQPEATARGCVLVVPPFAEEMNKCRRMVAEVSRGLAEIGIATVIPDLYGTGDSGGDFSDGDWAVWVADIGRASAWVTANSTVVSGILAVRLGGALTVHCISEHLLPAVGATVLWQPVFDGKRFLNQFLRLRLAASMTEGRKGGIAELRKSLATEGVLEVAGYLINNRLADDLDRLAALDVLPAELGRIALMEIASDPAAGVSTSSAGLAERTKTQGRQVSASALPGEPYWASVEIVCNPRLIQETVTFFGEALLAQTPPEASLGQPPKVAM